MDPSFAKLIEEEGGRRLKETLDERRAVFDQLELRQYPYTVQGETITVKVPRKHGVTVRVPRWLTDMHDRWKAGK